MSNNKKKDKKKNYSQNKYYEPEYFNNPISGFLITSNQNQEKNAVKDAYNFLNRYVEKEYERQIERVLQDNDAPKKKVKTEKPVEETRKEEEEEDDEQEEIEEQKTNEPAHQSTNSLLEKELKQYKKETRLFYNIDTKCKGIIFIKVNPLFKDVIDVKHLSNKIVKDVRENLIPVSRFCFKLIPIEFASKAALDTFEEQAKKFIQRKFKPEKPVKWVLHFKCRNNSKFTQKPFLDILIQHIGAGHSVDFKNPDYTFFVEINNHLMCMSVLKKFNTLKNYSLQLPGSIPPPKPKKEQTDQNNATNNAEPKQSLIGELEFEENNETEGQPQEKEAQVETTANNNDNAGDKIQSEEEEEEEIALV